MPGPRPLLPVVRPRRRRGAEGDRPHLSAEPIRSLRQGTRAHALRRARTCYNHLAGRLGVTVMAALLERGVLAGPLGTALTDRLLDLDWIRRTIQRRVVVLTDAGRHGLFHTFGVRWAERQ